MSVICKNLQFYAGCCNRNAVEDFQYVNAVNFSSVIIYIDYNDEPLEQIHCNFYPTDCFDEGIAFFSSFV